MFLTLVSRKEEACVIMATQSCIRGIWRRAWQPTPIFLPGESHGQRSLAGYSPWGHKESDVTERLSPRGQNVMLHCLDLQSNDISTDQDRKDKG